MRAFYLTLKAIPGSLHLKPVLLMLRLNRISGLPGMKLLYSQECVFLLLDMCTMHAFAYFKLVQFTINILSFMFPFLFHCKDLY